MPYQRPLRAEMLVAGILGAAGVAAAAASAHGVDERSWGAVSLVALPHAAAFMAFSIAGRHNRATRVASAIIALGVVLFAGDMALRALAGERLFPMAAPSGGIAMMAGWLGVALSAFVRPR